MFLVGLFSFAILLGLVTEAITSKVEDVKRGNYKVCESGHTVILNFNDQTVPLLRQMAQAVAEGRDMSDTVVILTEGDRENIDETIENADLGKRLNVITRSGNPYARTRLGFRV